MNCEFRKQKNKTKQNQKTKTKTKKKKTEQKQKNKKTKKNKSDTLIGLRSIGGAVFTQFCVWSSLPSKCFDTAIQKVRKTNS